MSFNILTIIVEGDDDVRFFEKIIKPKLEASGKYIIIWKYAQRTKKSIKKYANSISGKTYWDYLFICDLDFEPCIRDRIQKYCKKYTGISPDKCDVVIKTIEAWYLAGVDKIRIKNFGLNDIKNTEKIDKVQFNKMLPNGFDSRNDFMTEMLKEYDCQLATTKNRSFNHFYYKHVVIN